MDRTNAPQRRPWGAALPGWIPSRMKVCLMRSILCARLEAWQGLQAGSTDAIVYMAGWVDGSELMQRAALFCKKSYGNQLRVLISHD